MFCICRTHGQESKGCRVPMHLPSLSDSQILVRVRVEIPGTPLVSTIICREENCHGSGLSSKRASGDIQSRMTESGRNLGSSASALNIEETVEVGFR